MKRGIKLYVAKILALCTPMPRNTEVIMERKKKEVALLFFQQRADTVASASRTVPPLAGE